MCQNLQYLCNAQDTTQVIQEMQRNVAFVIQANEICTGILLHIYYLKNIQLVQMTNYHFTTLGNQPHNLPVVTCISRVRLDSN